MGALAAALALGAAPEDAKTAAPTVTPTPTKAQIQEARAVLRDFLELSAALDKEKGKGGKAAPKELTDAELLQKAARPARTVRKTSLEPAEIDALLEKTYEAAKVVPAKITGDEEFIRRVSLDVTGKLPPPAAVLAFRQSRDKNKRAELIDALLASPDYATNWARYFKDVVQYHATTGNPALVRFAKLEDWLAEQFARNRPWDEIAAEMITAVGNTGQDGATVFPAAHMGQAVEIAGEVSRVFLGVQIQCAQCHDHPSDPWKREQFHEFAAFFSGLQARRNPSVENGPSLDVLDRKGNVGYKMPDLKDPNKQIPVEPKFFLASSSGPLPANLSAAQRRKLAASYVTGQDNPWFARAFVNRVWYALVGEGFYSPVDDLGPTRESRAPEVLDKIAGEFSASGYDVRWLFRTILNTKAYQREFRSITTSAGRTPFAANCPSRLRADQIMDALGQALAINFDPAGIVNKKGTVTKGAKAEKTPEPQTPQQKLAAVMARFRGAPRRVQPDLRRRSVDPQRGRPGHDPPGPVPHEQPGDRERDPGQELGPRRDPRE